jgi:hypothetical protein
VYLNFSKIDVFETRYRLHKEAYRHPIAVKLDAMITAIIDNIETLSTLLESGIPLSQPNGQLDDKLQKWWAEMGQDIFFSDSTFQASMTYFRKLFRSHVGPVPEQDKIGLTLKKIVDLYTRIETRNLYKCVKKTIVVKNNLVDHCKRDDDSNVYFGYHCEGIVFYIGYAKNPLSQFSFYDDEHSTTKLIPPTSLCEKVSGFEKHTYFFDPSERV